MIIVKDCIVSDHLADLCFACDLAQCKGACCVEGDSGAPLREEEVPELERILPAVLPYMTEAGREAVARQGVAVRDKDGDLGTPLVDGKECAFAVTTPEGLTLCASEKAYRDGSASSPQRNENPKQPRQPTLNSQPSTLNFIKPVSCHLYPVRVEEYGEFTAVNYHEWAVCRCAVAKDNPNRRPLYEYLKEPLIRRFGQDWYDELVMEVRRR